MRQDFGSRLAISEKVNRDFEVVGFSVLIDGEIDGNWMRAIEHYTRPCKGNIAAMEIARLRSLTARQKQSDFDLELSIGALTEELIKYPEDILKTVCREWARSNVFFPTLKELIDACEKLFAPRAALLAAAKNRNSIAHNRRHDPEYRRPTDEEKEAVSKMLDECLGILGCRNNVQKAGTLA